jgi:rod shape-determining protein MreD
MFASTGLRTAVVLLGALVLQVCLLGRLPVFGVTAELMLLVAIAAGLTGGPERGAIVGFAAGLLYDLTLHTPLGLSALVFALAGYAVGGLQHAVLGTTWYTPIVVSAAASAGGVLLYGAFGLLVGQTEWLVPETLLTALIVAVLNGLLSPLVLRFLRWTEGEPLGFRLPSLPRRPHQPFRRGRRRRGSEAWSPGGLLERGVGATRGLAERRPRAPRRAHRPSRPKGPKPMPRRDDEPPRYLCAPTRCDHGPAGALLAGI